MSGHKVRIALLFLTAITVILVLAYAFWQQGTNEWQMVFARTATYCIEFYREADNPTASDGCPQWARYILETRYDILLACHRQSPNMDEWFNRCLDREGILIGRSLTQGA
jgi:hypothetical protein